MKIEKTIPTTHINDVRGAIEKILIDDFKYSYEYAYEIGREMAKSPSYQAGEYFEMFGDLNIEMNYPIKKESETQITIDDGYEDCPECDGTGIIEVRNCSMPASVCCGGCWDDEECEYCNGSGQVEIC